MANIFGRVMNAVRAGIVAFNQQALVPDQAFGWDLFDSRQFRYYHNAAYYHNTIYTDLVSYAAVHKHYSGLYRHIRPITNPVTRLVDIYVAKCAGGAIDMELFSKGAIPIAQADNRLKDAVRQLFIWSNWQTQKSLMVRYGAMLGDVVIKVVDDRAAQKVRLEPYHPGIVKDVTLDEVGNVKSIIFEYEMLEESLLSPTGQARQQKTYTYTETIDGEWFRTYRNGEPYAFYNDESGNPAAEWRNEYGFVPVVLGRHKNLGLTWGASAFHASLRKIDELNDAVSNLNDQIRKVVTPLWYFAGVQQEDELDTSPDSQNNQSRVLEGKDKLRAIYGPEGSQPYPMIAPIDIAAALANHQALYAELERDMPELGLYKLREAGNLTAPGVRAGYSDAIDRIMEARSNYDDTTRRAIQMGVSIGGYNRYKNFEGYTLDSYQRGDLDFYIADRPVIDDELPKETKVTILIQSGAPQAAVWKELGYTDDTIREWQRDIESTQQAQELQVQRQIDALAMKTDQPGNPQGQIPQPQRQAIPEKVN